VTFETTPFTLNAIPALGVAAYGTQCGVNGIALSDYSTVSGDFQRVAPALVGVHGKGDNEGVQGEGPVGVHGIGVVPGTIGGLGLGVQGDGGQMGVQGNGDTGVMGKGVQVGVQGNGHTGVVGDGSTGVSGTGSSAGVQGSSPRGRGGVFQTGPGGTPDLREFVSGISAQILLVPVLAHGSVEKHLPRAGHAGDLLVISELRVNPLRGVTETTPAELWFCTADGSNNAAQPGAVWAKVQFEKTVTVP
jgi:hypothetical protein